MCRVPSAGSRVQASFQAWWVRGQNWVKNPPASGVTILKRTLVGSLQPPLPARPWVEGQEEGGLGVVRHAQEPVVQQLRGDPQRWRQTPGSLGPRWSGNPWHANVGGGERMPLLYFPLRL